MSYLNDCLRMMDEFGASDLYLVAGEVPTVRISGELMRLEDEEPLTDDFVVGIAGDIFDDEQIERLDRDKNLDFAMELGEEADGGPWRLRGNVYFQKNGLNIVFRLIPSKVPTLEELRLPDNLRRLTEYHQGLVLCTGQAGCGKTATVAALLDIINHKDPVHIITIEDPIEYIFESDVALINQRQVGRDVESFSLALKGALREDPDVIFVGELRDLETIQLAITAAETGHLVFGTLHTNSAPKAVNRIIDAFPIEQQPQVRTMLSESLRGVVSQQLIPRADGNGRIAAAELLLNTGSIANLIRDGKSYQIGMSMQTGKKLGMCIMDESIFDLFKKGLITKEEAENRSVNRDPYRHIK
ncbi:type IV pilus twitching motility protein PilT [bacterium]|nr:type IV pilus twitching motility protein PilT [bacterium]